MFKKVLRKDTDILLENAVALLARLIETPSPSGEEEVTAGIVSRFLSAHGVTDIHTQGNNVWAFNKHFDPAKPTILLNSHHDTVRPNPGYTRDPYDPAVENGRLYGLGSNDAGASVVSLCSAFLNFYGTKGMAYNLCLAITAQEEISGAGGIESILPLLGKPDFAIVGEPTGMHMAIAERGLVVLDCVAKGKAGHAARGEGVNAIYKAVKDIEWIRSFRFPEKSDLFGEVKMSVTVINAGTQHNVVPAECRFTVDVRVTDRYTNEEVVETVRGHLESEVTARSVRLKPSSIAPSHPAVQAGLSLGRKTFGSPTTSDQVLLDFPSMKLGPGDSARSHSADEYICIDEIQEAIDIYNNLLGTLLEPSENLNMPGTGGSGPLPG